ncbi:hypothetical protein CARUB_v10000437mg [Capsella rubella]|uniref:rRNA methyltransferase n=1 Tax=Capsella rubella TaxID=81985 RepID=R0FDC5_9BRAS|nr:hypothetical protein CARUB_v10000437mg [Capsella rubella]
MGKVKGKHRLDTYYRLSKESGYRSRASYKLLQLDAKYNFLHSSRTVLDLCAAPGGWMQVAVQKALVGSFVLGIDLQDITQTAECKSKIKQVMKKHDGSPNVGGAWAQEAMSQNALVIDSLKLATELLAPQGNFITKIFRSRDYNSVFYSLGKLFENVEVFKPLASRSASAEIYLFEFELQRSCKKGRSLFMVMDVLGGSKQKRKCGGYEDGESILRKVASAADFIWSEKPLEILGTVTCISFDDQASLSLKENNFTTEEIKILCDDLPVLGKSDFRHILRWRMQIRKALSPEKKDGTKKDLDVGKEDEENEDDKLLNELEELKNTADRKKKQTKKLLHRLLSFGKKELMAVDNDEDDHDNSNADDSDNEEGASDDFSESVIDSDEERQRCTELMEEIFDEAYDRKRARQAHAEKLEDNDKDEAMKLDYDSDMNEEKDEANPLVVTIDDGEVQTKEDISNQWFSQDIFSEAMEERDLGNADCLLFDQSFPNSSTKEEGFEIDEGLPKWFLDDEKKHRQPMKPVTKEEVNAMKAQFKEINSRPAKKVAEAKARKKRAAMKSFKKVRKKENTISDIADISNRSKDKMIDKLYKKAAEPTKPKKELVVSKKGVGVKVGKGQKRVDRMMKRRGGKPGRNRKKSACHW